MPITDFFNSDSFSMVSLTTAINKIPNMYGRLQELGIFSNVGVTTNTILVEEQDGVLNLLPTAPRGGPATVGKVGKRIVRSFVLPHIPHDDVVMPEEVQGIRTFGSESATDAVAAKVAYKLQTMRNKHAITLEYLRMGAIKGLIVDADATTIYDLYSQFNVSQYTVDFVFGTSTTEIREKCAAVLRHIEDNLKGEVMREVRALVSPTFYDKLVRHATVKTAYQYFQQTQNLSGDFRKGFTFGGITFEEYRGTATDSAGTSRPFIVDGEAHAFPVGTMNCFQTFFGPADFNETANTIGLELYAKQQARDFNRGIDLHTQSNPLPMCNRPELLVKLYTSN